MGTSSDLKGESSHRWPRLSGRRARKFALWTAASLAVLALVFHAAGGWYFASALDRGALSAEARRESLKPNYDVRVLAVEADSVTLRKAGDKRLSREGTFGLDWEGGWGTIGQIISKQPGGAVVRAFEHQSGAPLQGGMRAAIDSRVFPDDPLAGRGVTFRDVTFPGEAGQFPAWFIPGTDPTWFVFVHGNAMTRLDGLRVLPAVVQAGMPVLLPTYRGDAEAPGDPNRRLTYGKEEWHDLEAAVRYALDNGAQSVVLQGVSMGGAIVVAFLLESPLARNVSGVVLDSPVLDFERAVEFQAGNERLPFIGLPIPRTLVNTAEWLAQMRFGLDWGFTHYLERADELSTPILLIHGTDDETVPIATSRDLAHARPDLVRDFYTVEGAGHVEAWNVDPVEYERRLVAFLNLVRTTR